MQPSRTDAAFERFRATGEPAQLAQVFDATAPELFRLAWHLIGERHAAEDLVQATFLAAIEDARTFTPERRVMPWLCGILANRARELRRRQTRPPAATSSPASADPRDEAATRELGATVAAAIRSLEEPYRQVLLLHLEHGLAGVEIAETLTRPEATVRSQLHRGLEQLRKLLPASLAGSALAAIPSANLAAIRTALFGELGVSSTLGWLGIAWTMKKLSLVAVSLLLGLFAWRLWPEPAAPSVEVANAAPTAPATAAVAVATKPADAPAERQPVADAGATITILEVTAFTKTGAALADVELTWQPLSSRGVLRQRSLRTDQNGRVRFVDLPPGKAFVQSDRGGDVEVELFPGKLERATLQLPGTIEVHGTCVDARGNAVADAEVWLGSAYGVGAPITRSARDGTFVLMAIEAPRKLGAWAAGLGMARGMEIKAASGPRLDCTLVLIPTGPRIEGTVMDREGRAIANATVRLEEHAARWRPDSVLSPIDTTMPDRQRRTDAAGHFVFDGAPRGKLRIWAGSPHHAAWVGELELAGVPVVMPIQLGAGAALHGIVRDAQGKPVANAWVCDEEAAQASRNPFHQTPGWAHAGALTASDGGYEVSHLMPGLRPLRATRGPDLCANERMLVEGERVEWSPQFGIGPRFAGVVVDPDGMPLTEWHVQADGKRNGSASTDANGAFAINVAAGTYCLRVIEPKVGVAAVQLHDQQPGPLPLRIEVPWARLPTARFTGALCDAEGKPLVAERIDLQHLGDDGTSRSFHEAEQREGRFTTGLLFPGRYRLLARAKDHGELRAGPFVVGRSETTDLGTLRFQRQGRLSVRVVGADSMPARDLRMILLRAEPEVEGIAAQLVGGVAHFAALQPGAYRVATWSGPAATLSVDVRADQHTEVDLLVRDGVPCSVRYPPIPADNFVLHQTWRNSNGEVAYDHFGRNDKRATGFDMPLRIAPGRYTITVEDASGRTATTTADIVAQDPPVTVTLPLPGAK